MSAAGLGTTRVGAGGVVIGLTTAGVLCVAFTSASAWLTVLAVTAGVLAEVTVADVTTLRAGVAMGLADEATVRTDVVLAVLIDVVLTTVADVAAWDCREGAKRDDLLSGFGGFGVGRSYGGRCCGATSWGLDGTL